MIYMLLILAIAGVAYFMFARRARAAMATRNFIQDPKNVIPVFSELQSGYAHGFKEDNTYQAVMGVIELNLDQDGTKAIMVTGAKGQSNGVIVIDGGVAKNIAAELGLEGDLNEATYGLVSGDIDGDGQDEIIAAQESGIVVFSRKKGENRYTSRKLDISMPEFGVPLHIALADTRKSGHLDMYVSTYIDRPYMVTANFNNPCLRVENIFLQNNGDGTFTDRTKASGLALRQNTFLSKFADLTGNGYPDLVVALNTDRVLAYENLGDGTFKQHVLVDGYGYWMGIEIADLTNNGRPDIYLSNIGNSLPAFLVKGDTRPDQRIDLSFRLLRNDGDFKFTDVTKETGADTNVFGWGVAAADFTGNGRLDLVVTENYTAFPLNWHKHFPSPGRLLVQGSDEKFVQTQHQSGVANPHFGYAALPVDLAGNGQTDLVIGNIGGPLRIFINKTPKH
jgi:hypothetical protein